MVVTLCVLSLLLVLSLSLLYGAGQLMSNANKRAAQVTMSEAAYTMSETIRTEITDGARDENGTLYHTLMEFLRQGTLQPDGTDGDRLEYSFFMQETDRLPEMTITLRRGDFSTLPVGVQTKWLTEGEMDAYAGWMEITVKASSAASSASVTGLYECTPVFDPTALTYAIQQGDTVTQLTLRDGSFYLGDTPLYDTDADGSSRPLMLSDIDAETGLTPDNRQLYRYYMTPPAYVFTYRGGV